MRREVEDAMLVRDALAESRLANTLKVVEDGEQMLDYLYRRGRFTADNAPCSGLILLDLTLSRVDGRGAVARIMGDPDLGRTPVVVLTTSKAEEDVFRSHDVGANS